MQQGHGKSVYASIAAYGRPAPALHTPQQRQTQVNRIWAGYYSAWQPAAAVVIQAHWRGYWTRKQLRAQRTGRLIRAYAPRVQRDSAARVIQRFVRGWLGRLAAREVRGAAVTIQRWWRGYRERKGWRRRLRQFRWDTEAAVTIQRFARGFLVRRRLAREARGDSPDQRRQQAATVIQKCYRGMRARRRLRWLKQQLAKRQRYSATVIQRHYRAWKRQQQHPSPPPLQQLQQHHDDPGPGMLNGAETSAPCQGSLDAGMTLDDPVQHASSSAASILPTPTSTPTEQPEQPLRTSEPLAPAGASAPARRSPSTSPQPPQSQPPPRTGARGSRAAGLVPSSSPRNPRHSVAQATAAAAAAEAGASAAASTLPTSVAMQTQSQRFSRTSSLKLAVVETGDLAAADATVQDLSASYSSYRQSDGVTSTAGGATAPGQHAQPSITPPTPSAVAPSPRQQLARDQRPLAQAATLAQAAVTHNTPSLQRPPGTHQSQAAAATKPPGMTGSMRRAPDAFPVRASTGSMPLLGSAAGGANPGAGRVGIGGGISANGGGTSRVAKAMQPTLVALSRSASDAHKLVTPGGLQRQQQRATPAPLDATGALSRQRSLPSHAPSPRPLQAVASPSQAPPVSGSTGRSAVVPAPLSRSPGGSAAGPATAASHPMQQRRLRQHSQALQGTGRDEGATAAKAATDSEIGAFNVIHHQVLAVKRGKLAF